MENHDHTFSAKPLLQRIDLLFGPIEIEHAKPSQMEETTCIVIDVLRFTTTAAMALANGAKAVIPAKSIGDALILHEKYPGSLLAGERGGSKIGSELTGERDFDLGNSPREFTRDAVEGRVVISTTTNGTIALNACKGAENILAASFLNAVATVSWILKHPTTRVCLVCSGTHEENSYEDMLGAGAVASMLIRSRSSGLYKGLTGLSYSDSVLACCMLYQQACRQGLKEHFSLSRNGKNLGAFPHLAEDVPFAARTDICRFAIQLKDGQLCIAE